MKLPQRKSNYERVISKDATQIVNDKPKWSILAHVQYTTRVQNCQDHESKSVISDFN